MFVCGDCSVVFLAAAVLGQCLDEEVEPEFYPVCAYGWDSLHFKLPGPERLCPWGVTGCTEKNPNPRADLLPFTFSWLSTGNSCARDNGLDNAGFFSFNQNNLVIYWSGLVVTKQEKYGHGCLDCEIGGREDSGSPSYPVSAFPGWLEWLSWSLLCQGAYSDTDSDRSSVIDSDKALAQYPPLCYLFFPFFSPWQLHMISLLWPPPSHWRLTLGVRSVTAICCTTLGNTACSDSALFSFQLLDERSRFTISL